MDSDLEKLSEEELKKIIQDNDDLDARIRKEAEENIGILEQKLQESRAETDEAIKAAIEILKQSIEDRKVRIAELKQQNLEASQKTQEMNGETMAYLTEIVDKLKINSITDIPAEITKLKNLEKEAESLRNQIQQVQNGKYNSNASEILDKVKTLLYIWDKNSLKLPTNSPLEPIFTSLREWLSRMKDDNFADSNTASNNVLHEIEKSINQNV